ncbi:MAG: HNH endonuclease [Ignavibacteriae bacterium]|nr:HNH endonuclease [Ignavibacteriota bacterium]
MMDKLAFVPSPFSNPSAYVDTHNWPADMEAAVIKTKGNTCVVSGCGVRYETLDHIVPWSKGGRTSVENLQPMCNAHNSSKGDTDYPVWLAAEQIRRLLG